MEKPLYLVLHWRHLAAFGCLTVAFLFVGK